MLNKRRSDKAKFSDQVLVERYYPTSVNVEGKDVPIVHKWGRQNLDHYPATQVKVAKFISKFCDKVLGMPLNDSFFGTECIKVEKMREIYHPGIGNDAVHKLACKGYNYLQIAKKLGKPIVNEIHISHTVKELKRLHLNLMLNEGINQIWNLLRENDATNYYTNALARVGVGNSNTAAAATQTGLLGGSTAFAGMEGGFPTHATQRIDFKGSFGDGVAEFAWEEFTVDNGSTPNHNLQRLVSSKGTKTAGETWTAEIQITGS